MSCARHFARYGGGIRSRGVASVSPRVRWFCGFAGHCRLTEIVDIASVRLARSLRVFSREYRHEEHRRQDDHAGHVQYIPNIHSVSILTRPLMAVTELSQMLQWRLPNTRQSSRARKMSRRKRRRKSQSRPKILWQKPPLLLHSSGVSLIQVGPLQTGQGAKKARERRSLQSVE